MRTDQRGVASSLDITARPFAAVSAFIEMVYTQPTTLLVAERECEKLIPGCGSIRGSPSHSHKLGNLNRVLTIMQKGSYDGTDPMQLCDKIETR